MRETKVTCDGCGGSQPPSTVTQVPFRDATVDICEHCLDVLWKSLDRIRLSHHLSPYGWRVRGAK